MQAGSPVKESSFLNRETSAEDIDTANKPEDQPSNEPEAATQAAAGEQQQLPVRR